MIGKFLGLGQAARQVGEAVGGVAEVFVGNRAEREAAQHQEYIASLAQFSEEFKHPGLGWFDQFVNGLNRLPRPMLAIGTLGLFVYAMVEPSGFAERMQGLSYVPEPLWWLLGAVVSFYFGARELHHYRGRGLGGVTEMPAPRQPAPRQTAAQPREANSAAVPAEARPQASLPGAITQPTQEAASTASVQSPAATPVRARTAANGTASQSVAVRATDPNFNAAVEEWRLVGKS